MSMPPVTSTTSRPTAKITLIALTLTRSTRLPAVMKESVARPRRATRTMMTTTSQASVVRGRNLDALGIDRLLDPLDLGLGRHERLDDPAAAHVQDAVGVEVDLRDLVGDEQDRHPALGQPTDEPEDAFP